MNSNIRKIYYISELNLPNSSAYSIHVLKMCEAFSILGYKTTLFTTYAKNKKIIYKNYCIKSKFEIISLFNQNLQLNFILRIIFTLKILLNTLNKNSFIISRSIIFSLISSIFMKNIILELHHEITGATRIVYNILKFFHLTNNLNYIFLNRKLNEIYKINKKKFIVLDDAVNLEMFNHKNIKKYKNTCIYIGSFFEGKGIDQIFRLARQNKNINFHLYGDKKFLSINETLKNMKFFGYVEYYKIPKILSKYNVALMPYQNKIKGRSNTQIENYISPLKMFDYMAAGMIILASNIKAYSHILKNNYNCKLIRVNDDFQWSFQIQNILKNIKKFKYLRNNSLEVIKKYSWKIRAKKIVNFSKNF